MNKSKILMGVGIGILVLLLVISSTISKDESEVSYKLSSDPQTVMTNAQKESNAVTDEEKKEFTYINIDEYLEIFDKKEKDIVLVARPTCGYCQIAEPIIQKIAKDLDLNIKYLNTDDFKNGESVKFTTSDDRFKEGFGTPMLLFFEDGKIKDIADGLLDTAHYLKMLEDNGYNK